MSELEGGEGKPNLTPILDMVFQLITFFMLVINFKSASLDLTLKLPVVGSARPVDTKGVESLLILNVDKEGNINVYGRTQPVKEYIAREAMAALIGAYRTQPGLVYGEELPTTVVIRADRATPFRLLNRVIVECQQNGFLKYALKAMTKEEGKG
jgi:biopolymer transport protein ExbD